MRGSTAQCYNRHTTATPLWRKYNEDKTVCTASLALTLRTQMRAAVQAPRLHLDGERHHPQGLPPRRTPRRCFRLRLREAHRQLHASLTPNSARPSASISAGHASPTIAPDSTTTTHMYDKP
ncbi:hypothetical protein C8R45DRAFT_1109597 [Mycena sanguinolenta]|nr:hypothetical protein C8R45DRAFT_1109597 [Mycena sanguinolenta]